MRYSVSSLHKLHLVLLIIYRVCVIQVCQWKNDLLWNHLLDESFPSVIAFSCVLFCCVSSVVMKIEPQIIRCNNAVPLVSVIVITYDQDHQVK